MSKGTICSKSATPLHSKTSHVVTSHSHEWLIEDFVRREESTGSSLQTRFSVMVSDNKNTKSETVWRIKLYPKGCDADHSSYVSIFINQVTGPTVWVKYAISLLGCRNFDRTPYVYNTRRGSVQFVVDKRSSSRGWKKFISHEAVMAPGGSLLHDGALLIRCVVELECRDSVAFNNEGGEDPANMQYLSRTSSFTSFLDEMKYTDLTLDVNDNVFHCHKFMLAKKSDVFDAMFSHDFAETVSNKVVITDLESDAVLEMLRFIYTGKVQQMEKVNKMVLAAADKYNIADLKESCEKSLCNSMTVDNVCSLLLLARDRVSHELKRRALEFISLNVDSVTNSEGWQDLSRDPHLMTDIVRTMGPRNQ